MRSGESDHLPAFAPAAHQFSLLKQRHFASFFWTQFAGAANDNLFKFAFTVMATYQLSVAWLPPSLAGLVIGAVFILPFVLFSATSGQLADKFEKSMLVRRLKDLELLVMLIGAAALLASDEPWQVPLLLLCTFLMGLQSTLFGPVKFAWLPQTLRDTELVGGNGMVEMGTFVAILLGNMLGGLLMAVPGGHGPAWVAGACVLLALAGRAGAGAMPAAPAPDPWLTINWNPFTETWRNVRLARAEPELFRTMLGISWMWFFGAVFLSLFPGLAKEVLRGNEQVASLLLVVFSIGIGSGALLCERLGTGIRGRNGLTLVPLGALGMTLFTVDLYFAARSLPAGRLMGAAEFLHHAAHWRVMADLLLLSLSAGLYSVPMYAFVQRRSRPTHRARMIAALNILNALFMVLSALLAGALLGGGMTIPEVFLCVGLASAVVTFCLALAVPDLRPVLRPATPGSQP
jgi:MFS family permease